MPRSAQVCMTPRWREVASNHQYRVTRPRFREGVTTERQHKREPTPRKCIGILRGTDGSNPSPSSEESCKPSVLRGRLSQSGTRSSNPASSSEAFRWDEAPRYLI